MSATPILQKLLNDTNSDSCVIFDVKGNSIEALSINEAESIAAMGDAILSMCDKFLEDLNKGLLKQIYITTTQGHVVFSKINISKSLVVFNTNKVNMALLFHNIDEACAKLNEELN